MKFLVFSATLDRVALGMSLSARHALIIKEVWPGVWLIQSEQHNAYEAYEYLFGMPSKAPLTQEMKGGVSIILFAASDIFGFAPIGFFKWVGFCDPTEPVRGEEIDP